MIYKDFADKKLSLLGMGCMRFPTKDSEIDIEKTEEIIDYCIKNGINYFDTAWFYHSGNSERVLGKLLSKYDRQSYYIATKMPGLKFSSRQEAEQVFEEQLKRTGAGYFDFYLLHNVYDRNIHIFEDEDLGIIDFLLEQKKLGKIKHLGFSTHGSLSLMEEFLNRHADVLEFCQIQLNWIDWTYQDAKAKVELIEKYGLPVWVMEPLRGGSLTKLSNENEAILKALRPNEQVPAWAFRFLQGIDSVKMILSGMSDIEHAISNIKTFEEKKPLDDKEADALLCIAEKMLAGKMTACTACNYCIEECPVGLDIPEIIGFYTSNYLINESASLAHTIRGVGKDNLPSLCMGCRSCEAKCPQQIKISEIMAEFAGKLK